MAHWAELDENNIVTRVVVGNNDDANEGYDWLVENLGGTWMKTSYNTYGGVHSLNGEPFRKNYAGIDFTYDENRDAFIPPKPFESWILDEETCLWRSPVTYPTDGDFYIWDEETLAWSRVSQ